jgi:hypothetical protein
MVLLTKPAGPTCTTDRPSGENAIDVEPDVFGIVKYVTGTIELPAKQSIREIVPVELVTNPYPTLSLSVDETKLDVMLLFLNVTP